MSESHNATSKKCKKPLDKSHRVWYNECVKREDTPLGGRTPVKWKR